MGGGAAAVLLFGGTIIALLIAIPRDNQIREPINDILTVLCKPIDWVPFGLGNMLAEQQDPLLNLFSMIGLWILMGAILGAFAWAVIHWIKKMRPNKALQAIGDKSPQPER